MEDPIGNPILFWNPKYFKRKGRLRPELSGRGYKSRYSAFFQACQYYSKSFLCGGDKFLIVWGKVTSKEKIFLIS